MKIYINFVSLFTFLFFLNRSILLLIFFRRLLFVLLTIVSYFYTRWNFGSLRNRNTKRSKILLNALFIKDLWYSGHPFFWVASRYILFTVLESLKTNLNNYLFNLRQIIITKIVISWYITTISNILYWTLTFTIYICKHLIKIHLKVWIFSYLLKSLGNWKLKEVGSCHYWAKFIIYYSSERSSFKFIIIQYFSSSRTFTADCSIVVNSESLGIFKLNNILLLLGITIQIFQGCINNIRFISKESQWDNVLHRVNSEILVS